MKSNDVGVTYFEEDRDKPPFRIRIGGTSEFVSMIDPTWKRAWPPGKVEVVQGWDNERALIFQTLDEAINAAVNVWNIEGFHTSIESMHESR